MPSIGIGTTPLIATGTHHMDYGKNLGDRQVIHESDEMPSLPCFDRLGFVKRAGEDCGEGWTLTMGLQADKGS